MKTTILHKTLKPLEQVLKEGNFTFNGKYYTNKDINILSEMFKNFGKEIEIDESFEIYIQDDRFYYKGWYYLKEWLEEEEIKFSLEGIL